VTFGSFSDKQARADLRAIYGGRRCSSRYS